MDVDVDVDPAAAAAGTACFSPTTPDTEEDEAMGLAATAAWMVDGLGADEDVFEEDEGI